MTDERLRGEERLLFQHVEKKMRLRSAGKTERGRKKPQKGRGRGKEELGIRLSPPH